MALPPAVIFGDCIRVQLLANSSLASIWIKAKVENKRILYFWLFKLEPLPIKNVAAPARATVPREFVGGDQGLWWSEQASRSIRVGVAVWRLEAAQISG
jgi:hypothetical protein